MFEVLSMTTEYHIKCSSADECHEWVALMQTVQQAIEDQNRALRGEPPAGPEEGGALGLAGLPGAPPDAPPGMPGLSRTSAGEMALAAMGQPGWSVPPALVIPEPIVVEVGKGPIGVQFERWRGSVAEQNYMEIAEKTR